nr:probable pectinesterase 55 [Ipomoea trifida]
MKQAVAAMITGDKTAFYRCGFSGVQDTLLDAMGRHYFKHCTIEGAVDFIFGAGQSIYEECRIVVNAGSIGEGTIGYITAQGRSRAQDSNAFVFKNSEVVGNGRALLGRAWRSYARTIFYNSSLSNIVVPQGWDSWSNKDYEHQLTFAEVECYGPGSDTSKRVPWEARLSQEMVKYFTSMDFIDGYLSIKYWVGVRADGSVAPVTISPCKGVDDPLSQGVVLGLDLNCHPDRS